MTRWTIRRTQFGWSLLYDGDLVASADTPDRLLYGMNACCGVGGQG